MIHLLSHPIEYKTNFFGIFGIESMRIIEGIYAFMFSKYSGISDPYKCFLIKNGRKPNKAELKFQEYIRECGKVPTRCYWFNWSFYCSQNILLKNLKLMPSMDLIRKESTKLFGHYVPDEYLHTIAKLVRFKMHDLRVGYYGVNVWQSMIIVASLDSIGANRSTTSIKMLFNKIYKREPLQREIDCCTNLQLTTAEEIQNEIESFGKIISKRTVSARRSPR